MNLNLNVEKAEKPVSSTAVEKCPDNSSNHTKSYFRRCLCVFFRADPDSGCFVDSDSGRFDDPDSGRFDDPDSGCYDDPDSGCFDNTDSGCFDDPDSVCYDDPNSGCFMIQIKAVLFIRIPY
jgi:hypothetical protein